MVLLQTSPCDNYECQNGAQCIVVHHEPVCRCLAGFAGQKCEKLITVNFVGKDSYVELPSAKIRPQANISLQVSSSRQLSAPLSNRTCTLIGVFFLKAWDPSDKMLTKLESACQPVACSEVIES